MITIHEIIKQIEQFAPTHLAEEWDPIGLAIGSKNQKVKKMMVALDLDHNTLKEAKEKNIDFIFTHHPPIFNSLKKLTNENTRTREYIDLIKASISIYAAHTNVDVADNGMNDWLANKLDLQEPREPLTISYQNQYHLLTIYTSINKFKELSDIIFSLDGNKFDFQSMNAKKIENDAKEQKFELIISEFVYKEIDKIMKKVFPNYMPLYYISKIDKKDKIYGIGRIGNLNKNISIKDLITQIKNTFSIPIVRVANVDLSKQVQRIAILGGSGESYYHSALSKGADIYITGDISYHGGQDMIRDGLPFIDVGHFIENIFVSEMTKLLNQWKKENDWQIEIIPASSQEDVFTFK